MEVASTPENYVNLHPVPDDFTQICLSIAEKGKAGWKDTFMKSLMSVNFTQKRVRIVLLWWHYVCCCVFTMCVCDQHVV